MGDTAVWLAVTGVAAGLAALLSAWFVRRTYQKALRDVARQLASLRDNPSHRGLQEALSRPPSWIDLDDLCRTFEDFATGYRQAVDELVATQEMLDKVQALTERAGVEKGYSLSFINRPDGISRSSTRLVARLTPTFHWMAATPALQKLLGQSLAELNARPFLDVVHPDDVAGLRQALHDALKDGEGHNITFRVRPRAKTNGHDAPGEHHLQLDLLTRYTNDGQPLHLRCHFVDVSERVRTDRELRQRTQALAQANERLRQINSDLKRLKERYLDLYNNAPVMYFSLDPHGTFVTCNNTMLSFLGYTRAELLGGPYTRVLAPAARDRYVQAPARHRQASDQQAQWAKKDGTVIDVHIVTTARQGPDGTFQRSRSVVQDVTESNRLLNGFIARGKELELTNARLRQINQELDQFTHVVSHDLKEPLRTLEAFSTFLQDDYGERLGDEGREYIDHLAQASRRLGRLIDDLLALSRVGQVIRTPRPVALGGVLRTVLGDLHDLLQRREAVVRVEDAVTACPPVAGDAQRLSELFANLIGNGLKYNTSPRPEVVVGIREAAEVTVYVRDNGIGIDPRYHEQVFGLFRRLHRREEYEGTGAGLAICKKIVEAHGGRIWVESASGQGSTFLFTLPRAGAPVGDRPPGGEVPAPAPASPAPVSK
jgi:PAS domain S-box-containing protein